MGIAGEELRRFTARHSVQCTYTALRIFAVKARRGEVVMRIVFGLIFVSAIVEMMADGVQDDTAANIRNA